MTEDEQEIKNQSKNLREIWELKRLIRVSFKRDYKAPDSLENSYKIGKIIGRGSISKVNLAIHCLSRKLLVIKSVKKVFKNQMGKIANEMKLI